jgi:hypothetical protein
MTKVIVTPPEDLVKRMKDVTAVEFVGTGSLSPKAQQEVSRLGAMLPKDFVVSNAISSAADVKTTEVQSTINNKKENKKEETFRA